MHYPSPYGDEPRDAPLPAQDGYRAVAPGLGRYNEREVGGNSRQHAIAIVLDRLDTLIPKLVGSVHQLEERLEPILRIGPPIGAGGTAPRAPQAALPPLAERLRCVADQLVNLVMSVEELGDRVEL
jgi:hypothetical protein